MSALRIKRGLGEGNYDLLDPEGDTVAQIHKKVEHYNLRRPVTVTSWLLWYRGERVTAATRRKDAVARAEALYAEEQA